MEFWKPLANHGSVWALENFSVERRVCGSISRTFKNLNGYKTRGSWNWESERSNMFEERRMNICLLNTVFQRLRVNNGNYISNQRRSFHIISVSPANSSKYKIKTSSSIYRLYCRLQKHRLPSTGSQSQALLASSVRLCQPLVRDNAVRKHKIRYITQ